MDRAWWNKYRDEAIDIYQGDFASSIKVQGVNQFKINAGNSGAGAILFATQLGAKKIILLGVDCKHSGGATHWHGDHPKGLANAGNVNKFASQFEKVKAQLHNIDVVNCSRSTNLNAFRRANLEDEL